MLASAAVLLIAIGIAHSWLGERYILSRLLSRPLPKLFGSDWFTRRTLRFAWHVTTIAWFGFSAVLLAIETGSASSATLRAIVAATFAMTAAVALIASRGRHLSWIVFAAVALLCVLAGEA